jgi:hypothetical protein
MNHAHVCQQKEIRLAHNLGFEVVASQKFKSWNFLKLALNSKWISNFISKCLFASWYQQIKYSGLYSLQNPPQNILQIFPQWSPSISFQKYRPDISQVTPFKFCPEILSKYSTDISSSIFLRRNTFRIIFQVPTNIFFIFPHAHMYMYASGVIQWALQANLTYTRQIHANLPLILSISH